MEDQKRRVDVTFDGGDRRSVVLELPLGVSAATFNLERTVCSHGLFMMAPNYWDPQSKTLQRPLRLSLDFDHPEYQTSLTARISQPFDSPQSLRIQVFGTDSLSPLHSQSLLDQVRRMLRLSEEDERNVKEFQEIYGEAKERGLGRVFRSPTLFEDMVKCILLCNCQWSRTLSMARALCELQWELQHPLSSRPPAQTDQFIPKTPAGKESKRNRKVKKCAKNLTDRFLEVDAVQQEVPDTDRFDEKDSFQVARDLNLVSHGCNKIDETLRPWEPCQTSIKIVTIMSCSSSSPSSEGSETYLHNLIGNFPSPKELASLDESLLAKRCNLGYRASRILKFAQHVVEGKIQLRALEEACRRPTVSSYDELLEQLKEINGFGPFTCANVLMCMGFYHVIPTDSETIRHLKQVHAKHCSVKTVQKEVEGIYAKYTPFQFLAYWSEVWQFYEDWFGKSSEMDPASYKLITAANMKPEKNGTNKRIRISVTRELSSLSHNVNVRDMY